MFFLGRWDNFSYKSESTLLCVLNLLQGIVPSEFKKPKISWSNKMQQGPFWWKVKPMLNVSDLTGEENGLIFSLLGLLIKLPHQYHLQIRFHLPARLGHTEDEHLLCLCFGCGERSCPSLSLIKARGKTSSLWGSVICGGVFFLMLW